MKIVVCVKRVPDTATKIKVGAEGNVIDTKDVEFIPSPYDELAVEYAVRIQENQSDVEVVIVTLGPAEASTEKVLRRCLAIGANRAILIESAGTDHDPYVIASALANTIKEESPDLLLFGIQAIDDDYGQVSSITSALLDMPLLWGVSEPLELGGSTVKGRCEVDGGVEILESSFPCAASIKGSITDIRMCPLIKIRRASKKEIKNVSAQLEDSALSVEKLELPAERVGGRIVGQGADAVPELFRLLREEAKVL